MREKNMFTIIEIEEKLKEAVEVLKLENPNKEALLIYAVNRFKITDLELIEDVIEMINEEF